jgi:enterochelin esterase family protein
MNVLPKVQLIPLLLLAASHWVQAQQAHVNLDWNPQKNTQQLVPFGANVISPDVADDRTVTFRLKSTRCPPGSPGPRSTVVGAIR